MYLYLDVLGSRKRLNQWFHNYQKTLAWSEVVFWAIFRAKALSPPYYIYNIFFDFKIEINAGVTPIFLRAKPLVAIIVSSKKQINTIKSLT